MKLSDFDFDLPEDLIAIRPAVPRSAARLLVAEGAALRDMRVSDLPDLLRPGDRLVLNNTRVIPAHLGGIRHRKGQAGAAGARMGVTLLAPGRDGTWQALVRPLKKLRKGDEVRFSHDLSAECVGKPDGQAILRFNLIAGDFDRAIARIGAMPLPPYITAKRAADDRDRHDYQSVFARRGGAVAAPTASLHFDAQLLHRISGAGVDFTEVTLHVGAGTFLPVKVDDPRDHTMHSEWGEIGETAADEINATRQAGGRIIPVGTTALRLIESAAPAPGVVAPWSGKTDIFIMPGHRFRIADALMTNFHLPGSTLMMLVSALMGVDEIRRVYSHAIGARYRFFSYGDACLLVPPHPGAGR